MDTAFISNIDFAEYHSKVSYSLYMNGNFVTTYTHNTGCDYLLQLFAKALAGEDTRNMKPVLIDLKANNTASSGDPGESEVATWPSVLPKRIALTGRQYANIAEIGWSTVITVTIPWSMSLATNASGYSSDFSLCLYSQTGQMLAYFIITNETIKSFVESGSGSTILIEWIMTVSNQ